MTGAHDEDEDGYSLVLAFDSNDPEFIRGFEAGRIWAALKAGERQFTVHQVNAEMVLRMAEAQALTAKAEPVDDNYFEVEFSDAC